MSDEKKPSKEETPEQPTESKSSKKSPKPITNDAPTPSEPSDEPEQPAADEPTEKPQKEPKEAPSPKQDKKSKIDKKQKKKEESKKADRPDDFQYIVRIANTDINGDYTLVYGLSQIKGIGRRLAYLIADTVDIPRNNKMGTLKDTEIEKIREALTRVEEIAPPWMLNHRNDYDSGDDIHLISTQVELRLRDDINLLKMIRSYRGIRHEFGLPVRGQRTRANNRTGLSLGVSKKKP